jgi:hypothetical protein
LAKAVGLSTSTIKRLERRAVESPPLWWYVNCAIALGVELEDVLDAPEREWRRRPAAPRPPGPAWLEERAERANLWRLEERPRRRL